MHPWLKKRSNNASLARMAGEIDGPALQAATYEQSSQEANALQAGTASISEATNQPLGFQ